MNQIQHHGSGTPVEMFIRVSGANATDVIDGDEMLCWSYRA